MNAAALLALIGELYERVAMLTEENRQLREQMKTEPEEAKRNG